MRDQESGFGNQDFGFGIQGSGSEREQASPAPESPAFKRVCWRARRGLLELDIVLGRFIEAQYAQLDEAGREAFEALLEMPDNPLWDMIAGRLEAVPGGQQTLLEKIRAL